jgi:hypothetical protein
LRASLAERKLATPGAFTREDATMREEQEAVVVAAAAALFLVAIFWSSGLLG